MRLLVYNPNTNPVMTRSVARVATARRRPDTEVVAETAAAGPAFIGDPATIAEAAATTARLLPDLVRRHAADAVVLACFGDPGLVMLKRAMPVPVVGLVEAAFALARGHGRRAGIVTGAGAWLSLLPGIVADLGYAAEFSGVAAIGRTGAEVAADPAAALDDLAAAARPLLAEGAECMVLGGAAFAGLSSALAVAISAPVVEPVAAAVRLAEMLAARP